MSEHEVMVGHEVHVFVNRKRVEFKEPTLSGAELLTAAGFDPASYDLFRLQGEGDPSGGAPVKPTDTITVKNGEHFRAIPGNRNFGA